MRRKARSSRTKNLHRHRLILRSETLQRQGDNILRLRRIFHQPREELHQLKFAQAKRRSPCRLATSPKESSKKMPFAWPPRWIGCISRNRTRNDPENVIIKRRSDADVREVTRVTRAHTHLIGNTYVPVYLNKDVYRTAFVFILELMSFYIRLNFD